MFSVVAMKSRTFSSFPCSAEERVCWSWEGRQPARQPSWSVEIFHTMDFMLSSWVVAGGRAGSYLSFLFRWVRILSCVGLFQGIQWNSGFPGSMISAWRLAANQPSCGEKICVVYSLFCIFILSLFLLLLILVIFVILVFPLLPYWPVFTSAHELSLLSISPPHPAAGERRGERAAGWCWVAGCCQLELWQLTEKIHELL